MDGILNFNIGILGHVDSGKTSLAKAISSTASTAAFDKNPQSQSRGITIDLGFSSFIVDAPEHVSSQGYSTVQFTLVDCPGHASLIRTIIGGAHIIDAMILVIDITKGMQTQTAECLIVGEILCNHMIVVLNKIDLISEAKRKEAIDKMSKKIWITLKNTKFDKSTIVSVSSSPSELDPLNIPDLIESLRNLVYVPKRCDTNPFVLSVDHCFGVKGQGTVITGTILQGSVCVNDNIDIPSLKITKKVKSIQVFRRPVERATQGDRIGLCVTQFDPKLLERSIVGAPNIISCCFGLIAFVHKIRYYKLPINSKSKFHISLGHDTLLGTISFFGTEKEIGAHDGNFSWDDEYPYQTDLIDINKLEDIDAYKPRHQFAIIEFERAVPLRIGSNFIASKLDMDAHTSMCRLAFWGTSFCLLSENYRKEILPKLKVFKDKSRSGLIERMNNDQELIAKDLLKKGTDINVFLNLKVNLSTGETAVIDSYFGQSGKVKLRVLGDLKSETKLQLQMMSDNKKKNKKSSTEKVSLKEYTPITVQLKFKKYVFSTLKKIVQNTL